MTKIQSKQFIAAVLAIQLVEQSGFRVILPSFSYNVEVKKVQILLSILISLATPNMRYFPSNILQAKFQ